MLCAVLGVSILFATGCGDNGNDNGSGTEAPYHDETDQKVNDTSNNGTVEEDLEQSGDSLKGAGENLMDSVEETGDAIRDGVDNLGNDTDNANGGNGVESEDAKMNLGNGTTLDGTIEENGMNNDMDVAP